MLEDSVEHRPGVPAQIGHELTEFAIEVAEKQQRLLAQHRETRVVNRADGIRRLKQLPASMVEAAPRAAFASAGDFKGKLSVKWFWLIVCFFLIVGSGECFLCGLSIRRSHLLRAEIEGQLVNCPGKTERNGVAIVHRRAGIHADVEGLVYGHK